MKRGMILGGLIFGTIATFSWMGPALADTKVLSGKHTVIYDIVNPLGVEFLPSYANNSYSQKVLQEDEFSKRLLIEVNLGALNSKAPFPIPFQQLPSPLQSFLISEKDIPANESALAERSL